jgi:hypothetical protein
MIFEYMIAREIENPITARLWRLLLACSITPQIRQPPNQQSSKLDNSAAFSRSVEHDPECHPRLKRSCLPLTHTLNR